MKLILIILIFLQTSLDAKEVVEGWGLSLNEGTSHFKIGGRIQGIGQANLSTCYKDLYLRRARVNLQYQTENHHMIFVDLRNDNTNKGDEGEGKLLFGDIFYEVPVKLSFIDDITFFRSKVDVSYSQTSSSKNLINPNRSRVNDYASNFVVHNRRATNVQLNGGNSWLTYQLVVSDGINSDDTEVLEGTTSVSDIEKQDFTYGLKTRFYLWNGGEDKKAQLQETFYDAKKTLSIGVGFFTNPKIKYSLSDGRELSHSRQLYNLEFSFAYNNFRLLGEGFLFKGDILNPSLNKFGDGWGSYVISEYLFGKFAPYFGLNYLRRDTDQSGSHESSQLVGVNYYARKEHRRYGISFENIENGRVTQLSSHRKIMTYMMLDY